MLPEDGREAEDEEFQPIPDSLSIEDLIGSGEFESKRSLKGDLRGVINVNSDQGSQGTLRTMADRGQDCKQTKSTSTAWDKSIDAPVT